MVPPTTSGSRVEALHVIERLEKAGFRALFAGGCVRDLLLGRRPSDYDVATSARPDEVRAVFGRVIPAGERFGVVMVPGEGRPVEVATFRHDAVYDDGRRPVSVRFTREPAEDARRRDFTVNGLFLDPRGDRVLDFVEGRRDLARGVLRAIGDASIRFDEDRLRMLRAVRFAAELGFEIESATFEAIRSRAPEIDSVSGERVRDELLRLLSGRDPRRGLELLRATSLLREILPELDRMVGVVQPPRFHPEGDVWVHTLVAVQRTESEDPLVRLAVLLHDVGKPGTARVEERVRFDGHAREGAEMAREIGRRLRLSRKEIDRLGTLVAEHLRFIDVRKMREAKLRRFLTSPAAADHLAVHRADCLASHGRLANWEFSVRRREEYLREPKPPPRLLTGRDLIEMGFEPGPEFARILGEAEDLTLEGKLNSRKEARDWARSRQAPGGGEDDA